MIQLKPPHTLRYPLDVEQAYEEWGANCGPCSIAAILGVSLAQVRPHLGDFEKRRYMNITHLKETLNSARVRYRSIGSGWLPKHGLAFVQWGGHENKPIHVQYRFTHTIAVSLTDKGVLAIFECNAPHLIDWNEWQRVMPEWMQEEKQGDGTFTIRGALEIDRRPLF